MKSIGMFEAKTHLSALVAEVEKGGEVVLTRAGRPVARLVSILPVDAHEIDRRKRAVEDLISIAKGSNRHDAAALGQAGVRALVERGRQ